MKTTVLWQGRAYGEAGPKARVLVRETELEEGNEPAREIITEHCDTDALGAESWRRVDRNENLDAPTLRTALLAFHQMLQQASKQGAP